MSVGDFCLLSLSIFVMLYDNRVISDKESNENDVISESVIVKDTHL